MLPRLRERRYSARAGLGYQAQVSRRFATEPSRAFAVLEEEAPKRVVDEPGAHAAGPATLLLAEMAVLPILVPSAGVSRPAPL